MKKELYVAKKMMLFVLAFALICSIFSPCLTKAEEYAIKDTAFYNETADIGLNRVFYEIFVYSFSDSNGDGIGDLRGIIDRLDYLNDGDPASGLSLGVEGIWLTPVYSSPSYHKYDVTDYYTIDPSFGTMSDLEELITACHARGMLVILDLPINHTGKNNRWYTNFINAHILNNSANMHYDYYTWIDASDPVPAGRHFINVSGTKIRVEANFSDDMPELNFDNEAVRTEMLNVAKYYLQLGVDGFRFDAAKYIYYGDHKASAEFWDWYIGELKTIKPDIYTIAEVWDSDTVTDRYASSVDCFNFTTSQASGLIAEVAASGNVNKLTAYIAQRTSTLRSIREDARNTLFIANHDTDRAAGYLTVASKRMQMAANLYLLSPGSPFIYYGEEIGLRGSRGGANTDANRRLAMLWGDGDTISDPPGTNYDASKQTPYTVQDLITSGDGIYQYYKKLLLIRKANPQIAAGTYEALSFADTKAGGFICTLEGSSVCVLHNTTNRTITLELSGVTEKTFTFVAAIAGFGNASLQGTQVTLEGQTSVVLR